MAIIKQKIPRRFPARWRKQVKRRSTLIGESVFFHNAVMDSFCSLFSAIVGGERMDMGLAIWHVISMDSTKLSLVEESAKSSAVLQKRKRLLKNIVWSVRKAQKLIELRNDAAHTTLNMTFGGEFVPSRTSNKESRLNRLKSNTKSTEKILAQLKGDYHQLSGYVTSLWTNLLWPIPEIRMPNRPRLQSLLR